MEKISNIRLNLDDDQNLLKIKAAKIAGIKPSEIRFFNIVKKSIDARKKNDIHFSYTVEFDIKDQEKILYEKKNFAYPKSKIAIIGFGPAGLFAGLSLARNGYCPIIIERGSTVESRQKAVFAFQSQKILNTESNIQFGEGGAGTFSDGKLNTGVKNPLKKFVLEEFVSHGAPKEILYLNKPHIGSDILPDTIKNIRNEIIDLGGEILFDTKFCGYEICGDKIKTITCQNANGDFAIDVADVVLAIGHSSRDTFEMLFQKGIFMEPKDMAVGFRIEHSQEEINKSQYGKFYQHKALGSADYKTVSHASNRGVFSFCMCPGGVVVPATSEENAVVTNGMSNFARNGQNANSAIVVQVRKNDYQNGVLGGVEFQRALEKKAFVAGGGNYNAPVQLVGDFLEEKNSKKFGSVKPTYSIGTTFSPLHELLPKEMTTAIQAGLLDMDKKLKGFACYDAILTGVETRTSSPVRVVRNENMVSPSCENLYPAGELGYAGGIMSSAMDGLKVANKIMEKYQK